MYITVDQLNSMLAEQEERIVSRIQSAMVKPKSIRIDQNQAYQLYGRANVRNWRLSGQLQAHKMGKAVEYTVEVLDKLMTNKQLIIKPLKNEPKTI